MAKILTLLVLLMTAVTGAWADEQSESFTTATSGQVTYTGEHFTITGQDVDSEGLWITDSNMDQGDAPNTVTISSKNGENITRIEAVIGYIEDWNGELASTSGNVTGTYANGQTITISSVNATTVTLSSTQNDGSLLQFISWTIYYESAASTTFAVDLTTTDNLTWTLASMPEYNLELEVEYYPLATLATLPAAAEGLNDSTTADLLTPGTSTDGTLAYALGTSEAPTGQWSQTIPTTEGLEAGEYYVWYKVVGDAEHSDSQPQSIAVTIAEAPAYAVTIDDAGKDTDNWQATPAEPKTGQTVTLSYSGKKKIKSITIEKAATAPAGPTLAETMTTADMTVKVNFNYNGGNYCQFLSNGDGTYTFQSGDGFAGGYDGWAKALVVENGKLVFKQNNQSTLDEDWYYCGYSVTFDTSNNTYTQWAGESAQDAYSPSFTSVEVNGTAIAVTAAQ